MINTGTRRVITCYLSNDEDGPAVIVHEREFLTYGDCACGAYQLSDEGVPSFSWDYHYSAKLALETGDLDEFRLVVA